MWLMPSSSVWHFHQQGLIKMNLPAVSFAADAIRILNEARLYVIRLYSIERGIS